MISASSSPLPYPLTRSSIGFEFQTDFGESYALYLSEGSAYFEGDAFAPHVLLLGLAQKSNNGSSPHDPRIVATLSRFIEEAFADSSLILAYVCDQSDNRESQRLRLFSRWFEKYNGGRYVRLVITAKQSIYAALLYRPDNPFRASIPDAIGRLRDKLDL